MILRSLLKIILLQNLCSTNVFAIKKNSNYFALQELSTVRKFWRREIIIIIKFLKLSIELNMLQIVIATPSGVGFLQKQEHRVKKMYTLQKSQHSVFLVYFFFNTHGF